MLKYFIRFFLVIPVFVMTNCDDGPKFTFSKNVVAIKKTGDIGSSNTASDFWAEIAVDENAIPSLVEIRTVFIDAGLNSGLISESDILALPSGNYHAISKFNFLDKNKLTIEPASSVNTSTGAPLSVGKLYKVAIAAIGKDNAISLPPLVDFELTSESQFAGKYTGTWVDEKIKNLGISMIVLDDNTGRLFYTKGFRPCCGGTEDATLEMTIKPDGAAQFIFNQYLGDYPPGTGQHCSANMSTNGRLDGNTLILNSFPFSDCDGGGRTVRISNMIRQ